MVDRATKLTTANLFRFLQRHFRNSSLHRWAPLNALYVRMIRLWVTWKTRQPVEFEGFLFFLNRTDVTVSPGVIAQTYESLQFHLLRSILRPGDHFLDIGANIGLHSVVGSSKVGGSGTVVSVEPECNNIELLERNLILNRCENVVLEKCAVSNHNGFLTLEIDPLNSGTHRIAPGARSMDAVKRKDRGHEEVTCKTLSEIAEGFSSRHIRLLKIDIEGFEPVALTEDFFSRYSVDVLIMEFVPQHMSKLGFSPSGLFSLLMGHFEACYIIDERQLCLLHVANYGDILESRETNLCLTNINLTDFQLAATEEDLDR